MKPLSYCHLFFMAFAPSCPKTSTNFQLAIVMYFSDVLTKLRSLTAVEKSMYEGWNFNSGNYLFTTDTK